MVSNFSTDKMQTIDLAVPPELIGKWRLREGSYTLIDELRMGEQGTHTLRVKNGAAFVSVMLGPLESRVLSLRNDHLND